MTSQDRELVVHQAALIRAARERAGLSQEELAAHLGVSRVTVTQIEGAVRALSVSEIAVLAPLFDCDLERFFVPERAPINDVQTLFRADRDFLETSGASQPLQDCLHHGRAYLDLRGDLDSPAELALLTTRHSLPSPRSKWEAIQQGETLALEERRRLGLGVTVLPDLADLLEGQGIVTLKWGLPDPISGFTLFGRNAVLVVTNETHPVVRRRFSYAHEYCHVLLDRHVGATLSHSQRRGDLEEVRANAFAASFLLPEDGVRNFLISIGRSYVTRKSAEVSDGISYEPIAARPRGRDRTAIGLVDIVRLAHAFGVSRITALFRLRNLGVISQPELDTLSTLERRDGVPLQDILVGSYESGDPGREPLLAARRRTLALLIEADRQEKLVPSLVETFCRLDPALADAIRELHLIGYLSLSVP